MAIKRLDNIGIIVNNLKAAVAFFEALGMKLEGQASVEGKWVDRLVGLEGVKSDIVMMRTPDGHGRIELSKFKTPAVASSKQKKPPINTLSIHRVMFAVDDIEDTIARLKVNGAELIGDVVQYEDQYLLCYIRGPEGIIVALSEPLK